jgi:hypothetical protein
MTIGIVIGAMAREASLGMVRGRLNVATAALILTYAIDF